MSGRGQDIPKLLAGKKFYLYIKRTKIERINLTTRFIKVFGGQIEQFLDNEVSYILTDVPKNEWPPNGRDPILEKATGSIKLMSLQHLLTWASRYVASESSDEEDEISNELKFMKFEDKDCRYAPTVIELTHRTELNLGPNLQVGQPLLISIPFSQPDTNWQPDIIRVSQIATNQTTNTAQKGFHKRKSPCDLCNNRIAGTVEEHVESPVHKANIDKQDYSDVWSVIRSLPSLSTLNMNIRLTDLTPNLPAGFVCLRSLQAETASQIFQSK